METDLSIDRRGFLGRAIGTVAALPILSKPTLGLSRRLSVGKLKKLSVPYELRMADSLGKRTLSMDPDMRLVGGQQVSMSSFTHPATIIPDWSGFGVIIYTDLWKTIIYELKVRVVNADV